MLMLASPFFDGSVLPMVVAIAACAVLALAAAIPTLGLAGKERTVY